jgi:hypothetical protein
MTDVETYYHQVVEPAKEAADNALLEYIQELREEIRQAPLDRPIPQKTYQYLNDATKARLHGDEYVVPYDGTTGTKAERCYLARMWYQEAQRRHCALDPKSIDIGDLYKQAKSQQRCKDAEKGTHKDAIPMAEKVTGEMV